MGPKRWWGIRREEAKWGRTRGKRISDPTRPVRIRRKTEARTKVLLDARVVVVVARFVAIGATVRDAVRLTAVPGRHAFMNRSVVANELRRVCCTYGILTGRLAGMGLNTCGTERGAV